MHNLYTVFSFEVVRTLKKKTFWLVSLGFPLLIGAVFGIIYFSNQATSDALERITQEDFSFAVVDDSSLINPELVRGLGGTLETSIGSPKQSVVSGELDALFYFPATIRENPVQITAQDVGIFDTSKYQSFARLLLDQSVAQGVEPDKAAVLSGAIQYDQTIYRDGEISQGILEAIAPGIFLVLFYFLIAFFGNQMLTSTTEEKENRVIEMILTTVEARTLIIGKILSLVVLGLIQTAIILVPVIILYFSLRTNLALPDIELSTLPIDPLRIAIGAAIFSVSFLMFTGLLVAIGAAVPTAKEANSFFGVVIVMIFGPLYAAPLFVSSPESVIVQFLSYFPLTAPIPLMLRNAVGNLSVVEALAGIAILALAAAVILRIAVRVFRFGVLEYSRKLSLREIVGLSK